MWHNVGLARQFEVIGLLLIAVVCLGGTELHWWHQGAAGLAGFFIAVILWVVLCESILFISDMHEAQRARQREAWKSRPPVTYTPGILKRDEQGQIISVPSTRTKTDQP